MASSQDNFWRQHELNRVGFSLSADMEVNLTELQRQTAKEFNRNSSISQPCFYNTFCHRPDNTQCLHEGDQVVPSSQRQAVLGGVQKEIKPLSPLPDPEELMSDEATDSEVEFFTSDRQRLLPKSCPKAISRSTDRDCGQVNYAYQESLIRSHGAGIGSMAFTWPGCEEGPTGRGIGFGANTRSLALQREDQPEQNQLSRLQFSHSGPDPKTLHSSTTTCPVEKPKIPPRIPIPPKPPARLNTLGANEEDKPPKIPPRVPLVPPCPPRTPSPKSLPIYINGVMPATQSFAANPKYVSKALQRHQSERTPPLVQFSPCIVPILKDGRQASNTHYILLPQGQQVYSDRQERTLSEQSRTRNSVCQNR